MIKNNKMRSAFWAIIIVFLFSACTDQKREYKREVWGIFVKHWYSRPLPTQGVVYVYKKGTQFKELIDTVRVTSITRGGDTTDLACIFRKKKFNHLNDLRLVLDDTLAYDISNIEIILFKDQRRWGMWGPTEWDLIPSLLVNGHVTRDTTPAGMLAFPRECGRIIKKR